MECPLHAGEGNAEGREFPEQFFTEVRSVSYSIIF